MCLDLSGVSLKPHLSAVAQEALNATTIHHSALRPWPAIENVCGRGFGGSGSRRRCQRSLFFAWRANVCGLESTTQRAAFLLRYVASERYDGRRAVLIGKRLGGVGDAVEWRVCGV